MQAVFGARGEHAVRLGDATGNQVINEHAEIGFVARDAPGRAPERLQRGIGTGKQTLRGGFFVAGGAVDLSGEKQALHGLAFKSVGQAARVEIIVFDGVAGARDVGVFQPANGAHQRKLHVKGQRGGNAVGIPLARVQPFRFQKDVVAVAPGEAVDFVFNGRAIARADTFDDAGVHGRAVQIGADDVVRARVRVGNPAGQLRRVLVGRAEKAEDRRRRVAGLFAQYGKINAAPVNARRRAGFQPSARSAEFRQTFRQAQCRRLARAPARVVCQANVHAAIEKRAGGEHHGAGAKADARLRAHGNHARAGEFHVFHGLLKEREVRRVFQHGADGGLVQRAVGLRARGLHRRAFAGVQGAELDAGAVGGARHEAAQGVDFAHQMAFANAADGRIAAHRAEGVDAVRKQQRLRAHARGGQRGFGTGMAAADDDDIKGGRVIHCVDAGKKEGIVQARRCGGHRRQGAGRKP